MKNIILTEEETKFLYGQLLARKNYFNNEMVHLSNDTEKVKWCLEKMGKIESIIRKL